MDEDLKPILEIAGAIIPAVASLAGNDKTGAFANDIVGLLKEITQEDDAANIKAKVEGDPAVEAALQTQLAEMANKKAELENQALEEQREQDLEAFQKELDAKEDAHKHEINLVREAIKNTNKARDYSRNAAVSERWWISGINPLLSVLIVLSFLGFVWAIAYVPIGGQGSFSASTNPPTVAGETGTSGDPSSLSEEDTAEGENQPGNNRDVFLVGFGALATAFATVIGFHFGSSSDSKRKTQLQRLYGTRGVVTGGKAPSSPPRKPHPSELETAVETGQATHPFEAFWMKNLAHIEHFNWKELLFKGASNARYKSNTDPDKSLYPNVVPLVNVLEKIRKELNAPVQLISVYRSPAYNRDVGGASASRHKEFDAADFKVLGASAGTSQRWYEVAKKLRDRGEFAGGIGVYRTFVHIDTRGENADWDNR